MKLLIAVLVLANLTALTYWGITLYGQKTVVSKAALALTPSPNISMQAIATLLGANTQTPLQIATAPPSVIEGYQVKGVLAGRRGYGSAMLADTQGKTQAYLVGEVVSSPWVLHKVETEGVVLLGNDQTVELKLPSLNRKTP